MENGAEQGVGGHAVINGRGCCGNGNVRSGMHWLEEFREREKSIG